MTRRQRILGFSAVIIAAFAFTVAVGKVWMFFTVLVPMLIGMVLIQRWKGGDARRQEALYPASEVDDPLRSDSETDDSPDDPQ